MVLSKTGKGAGDQVRSGRLSLRGKEMPQLAFSKDPWSNMHEHTSIPTSVSLWKFI